MIHCYYYLFLFFILDVDIRQDLGVVMDLRDEIYAQTLLKQSAKTACRTYSLTAVNKPSYLSKTVSERQSHRASIPSPSGIRSGDVVNLRRFQGQAT